MASLDMAGMSLGKMIPKVYQKNHEGKDMRFNMV